MGRIRMITVACAAVVAVAAPWSPATATAMATGQQTDVVARTANVTITRADGWVLRRYSDALDGARVVEYRGQAVAPDGCRYSGTDRREAGAVPAGMVVVEREVAHHAATCTMRTEVGLADDDGAAAPDGMRSLERPATPAAGSTRAPAGVAAITGAWHRTYYEDPVRIDVTSVQAELRWSYNWSCVTNSWDHLGRWNWFTLSGWGLNRKTVNAFRDCNGATTIVYGLFQNTPFCWPLPATFNEYDVTVVKTLRDGGYWMQWNAFKWGGCNELLSFHRSHGRM